MLTANTHFQYNNYELLVGKHGNSRTSDCIRAIFILKQTTEQHGKGQEDIVVTVLDLENAISGKQRVRHRLLKRSRRDV